MNCLTVAICLRIQNKGSSIHFSFEEKGPNGLFPHFYIILRDRKTVLEYRSLIIPLPWYRQLWFKGFINRRDKESKYARPCSSKEKD